MAFGQGAEDGPDHHGRLGIGDLAPVVGKGVPASHPEIAHGDDAVRRDGELGEETGNDRVPFGRPTGEQEQVAVVAWITSHRLARIWPSVLRMVLSMARGSMRRATSMRLNGFPV